MTSNRETIRFLFRTNEGTIDRRTWWSGALALAAILLLLTTVWLFVAPATHRDLSQPQLVDLLALGAYVYLIVYAFAVILIAVSWTNLGAKRFRAIGYAGAFAAGMPFVALLDGAAHWFQPQAPDILPEWAVSAGDVLMTGLTLATIYLLGIASRPVRPGHG